MGIIGKLTFYCQGCLVSVLGAIWRLMEPVCVYLVHRSTSYRNKGKRIAQSIYRTCNFKGLNFSVSLFAVYFK